MGIYSWQSGARLVVQESERFDVIGYTTWMRSPAVGRALNGWSLKCYRAEQFRIRIHTVTAEMSNARRSPADRPRSGAGLPVLSRHPEHVARAVVVDHARGDEQEVGQA